MGIYRYIRLLHEVIVFGTSGVLLNDLVEYGSRTRLPNLGHVRNAIPISHVKYRVLDTGMRFVHLDPTVRIVTDWRPAGGGGVAVKSLATISAEGHVMRSSGTVHIVWAQLLLRLNAPLRGRIDLGGAELEGLTVSRAHPACGAIVPYRMVRFGGGIFGRDEIARYARLFCGIGGRDAHVGKSAGRRAAHYVARDGLLLLHLGFGLGLGFLDFVHCHIFLRGSIISHSICHSLNV
mmetsp:Transcript_36062/g.87045  ORF Transcript_36062/g.87045 Transcript_36062/m.87045 type:complete len:235 (-) Transcript_36062:22-726(-)